MSKRSLQAHLEELKPLLLKRKPAQFDDSPEAAKLKRDIQAWNSAALNLLKKTLGAKASAAAFEELGRMKYGSLTEVKDQLRARLKVVEQFLGGAEKQQAKPTKPPKTALPKKKKAPTVAKGRNRSAKQYPFDVCFSFAGEDRKKVEQLYHALTAVGVTVFYDDNEDISAALWGTDLISYLDDIYQHQARHCVMFNSKHYVRKAWTNHERQSAQAREFFDQGYILPIRLDNTPVPGIRPTKGFKKWSDGIPKLTASILAKLGKPAPKALPSPTSKRTVTRGAGGGQAKRLTGHVVLLDDTLYVAQPLKRHKDGRSELTVKVSTTPALTKLRALAATSYSRVRFVDRFDAADVQVSLESETTQGRTTTVVLSLTPTGSLQSTYRMNISGTPPQELAQEQLRQLLLGEAPPQGRWYSHDLPQEVKRGVLPLASQAGRGSGDALQVAEALAVYYIRQKNIVDDIQELKFSRTASGKVNCSFKGSLKEHSGPLAVVVKGSVSRGSG